MIFSGSRFYDPIGNVITTSTTQASVPGQSGSGGSETSNACYDVLNRLVWSGNSGTQPAAGSGTCGSATLASGIAGAGYSNSYSTTNLGQTWTASLNGTGSSMQYLYCDSSHPHQLTGIYPAGTTCSIRSGATASYSTAYDAWGNQISRVYNGITSTLVYDVLDHLTQWSATGSTSGTEKYLYDASGARVLKRNTTGSTTKMTAYAFGLEEHNDTGTGTATGNTYYYSLGGRLIGTFDGTTTQYYLSDALGSVLSTFSAVANAAAVLGNQLYGPFGNQRYSKGSMGTDKGFTGQYQDSSGLDYYNARYYDPVVGIFVSADTVQGNGKGMDPYSYVANNPLTATDPTGQKIRIPYDDGNTYVADTGTPSPQPDPNWYSNQPENVVNRPGGGGGTTTQSGGGCGSCTKTGGGTTGGGNGGGRTTSGSGGEPKSSDADTKSDNSKKPQGQKDAECVLVCGGITNWGKLALGAVELAGGIATFVGTAGLLTNPVSGTVGGPGLFISLMIAIRAITEGFGNILNSFESASILLKLTNDGMKVIADFFGILATGWQVARFFLSTGAGANFVQK